MKQQGVKWLAVGIIILLAGCSTFERPKVATLHTYQQPNDLVFLTAFEALDSDEHWIMQRTDKEAGVIELINHNYGNLFGVDRQFVRFLVKSVNRNETSVELDQKNSRGADAIKLFERVNRALSRLPERPKDA